MRIALKVCKKQQQDEKREENQWGLGRGSGRGEGKVAGEGRSCVPLPGEGLWGGWPGEAQRLRIP